MQGWPQRIEDALGRVLLVATLVVINADILLWHLKRHQPAQPGPALLDSWPAITAEIPRIRPGRVYGSVPMAALAASNRTSIDPSTMDLMRRLDDELGQARGNSSGNTEDD